jgi:lysophospholipase L1-like esterase
LIAITPTPSRFKVWPKIQEANQALEAFATGQPNTHFIKTEPSYLTANGEPRSELFLKDKLHQNQQGYDLWSSSIKRSLSSVVSE